MQQIPGKPDFKPGSDIRLDDLRRIAEQARLGIDQGSGESFEGDILHPIDSGAAVPSAGFWAIIKSVDGETYNSTSLYSFVEATFSPDGLEVLDNDNVGRYGVLDALELNLREDVPEGAVVWMRPTVARDYTTSGSGYGFVYGEVTGGITIEDHNDTGSPVTYTDVNTLRIYGTTTVTDYGSGIVGFGVPDASMSSAGVVTAPASLSTPQDFRGWKRFTDLNIHHDDGIARLGFGQNTVGGIEHAYRIDATPINSIGTSDTGITLADTEHEIVIRPDEDSVAFLIVRHIAGTNLKCLLYSLNETDVRYSIRKGATTYDGQTGTYGGMEFTGGLLTGGTYTGLPPDDDYGDITVSSSGSVWTIDNSAVTTMKVADNAITYAKIQQVSIGSRLLGLQPGVLPGDVEEIRLGTGLTMTGDLLHIDGTVSAPSGSITMFGGSTVPTGYLECDGSAVSRGTYASLFSAIGTTWGAGDGSTTFNLPDLRGRAPIGVGTGTGLTARTLGGTGGTETHVLAETEIPAHTHTINTRGTAGNTAGRVSQGGPAPAFDGTDTTSSTGGGLAHNNMQPWAAVKFIIKT